MQRSCADVNSPCERKCRTNSVDPLVNSLIWIFGWDRFVLCRHAVKNVRAEGNTVQHIQRIANTFFQQVAHTSRYSRHLFIVVNHTSVSVSNLKAVLRIRIRDWVLFWPLDPGSGMGESQHPDPESGIRDEQPGSYFLELRNHFLAYFGV